jgi:hypothetical protein
VAGADRSQGAGWLCHREGDVLEGCRGRGVHRGAAGTQHQGRPDVGDRVPAPLGTDPPEGHRGYHQQCPGCMDHHRKGRDHHPGAGPGGYRGLAGPGPAQGEGEVGRGSGRWS